MPRLVAPRTLVADVLANQDDSEGGIESAATLGVAGIKNVITNRTRGNGEKEGGVEGGLPINFLKNKLKTRPSANELN